MTLAAMPSNGHTRVVRTLAPLGIKQPRSGTAEEIEDFIANGLTRAPKQIERVPTGSYALRQAICAGAPDRVLRSGVQVLRSSEDIQPVCSSGAEQLDDTKRAAVEETSSSSEEKPTDLCVGDEVMVDSATGRKYGVIQKLFLGAGTATVKWTDWIVTPGRTSDRDPERRARIPLDQISRKDFGSTRSEQNKHGVKEGENEPKVLVGADEVTEKEPGMLQRCQILECDHKAMAKGMCRTHYDGTRHGKEYVMKSASTATTYSGKLCDQVFPSTQALDGHTWQQHTKPNSEPNQVNSNGSGSSDEGAIPAAKILAGSGSDACDKTYSCKLCDKFFPSHNSLGGHNTQHHTKSKRALNQLVDSNGDGSGADASLKDKPVADSTTADITEQWRRVRPTVVGGTKRARQNARIENIETLQVERLVTAYWDQDFPCVGDHVMCLYKGGPERHAATVMKILRADGAATVRWDDDDASRPRIPLPDISPWTTDELRIGDQVMCFHEEEAAGEKGGAIIVKIFPRNGTAKVRWDADQSQSRIQLSTIKPWITAIDPNGPTPHVRAGDRITAIYAPNGHAYPAVVISVSRSEHVATVKWDDDDTSRPSIPLTWIFEPDSESPAAGGKIYRCKLCDKVFPSVQALGGHHLHQHRKPKDQTISKARPARKTDDELAKKQRGGCERSPDICSRPDGHSGKCNSRLLGDDSDGEDDNKRATSGLEHAEWVRLRERSNHELGTNFSLGVNRRGVSKLRKDIAELRGKLSRVCYHCSHILSMLCGNIS